MAQMPVGAAGRAARDYVPVALINTTTGEATDSLGKVSIDQSAPGLTNGVVPAAPYATSTVPVAASSGNAAAAIATCTLPGAPSRRLYMTGFQVTASGATSGLAVNVTVTGTVAPLNYAFVFPAGVLVGAVPLVVSFANPVPAAALGQSIIITLPSSGSGGTNAVVCAQGFLI